MRYEHVINSGNWQSINGRNRYANPKLVTIALGLVIPRRHVHPKSGADFARQSIIHFSIPARSGPRLFRPSAAKTLLREIVPLKQTRWPTLGRQTSVCALLDSGSQASFISERAAQQLLLKRHKVDITVSGLQGINTGRVTQAVSLIIGSEYSSDNMIPLLTAYVLPKLTSFKRWQKICKENWLHIQGLQLADPDYDKPSAIDVVFGADLRKVDERRL